MSPDDVAAAAAAWVWSPPGSVETATDEYRVIVHPGWTGYQQVVRFEPVRDPDVVVREVLDVVRASGRSWVEWWVLPGAWAADDVVRRHGGEPSAVLDLLARDLTGGLPPARRVEGVEVRRTADAAGWRDFHRVTEEVFGEPQPPDDELEEIDVRGATWVAYDGRRPVGTAGLTVVDGAARLWNGGVVESHRRRGVYGALLDVRLAHAVGLGARFALTRGQVDTSAPILRGSGFGVHGQQRGYRISLDPDGHGAAS